MSCDSGKIQMLGSGEIDNEKVMILQFLQGRKPEWVKKPFFASYNTRARWIDDLSPWRAEKFFFENG